MKRLATALAALLLGAAPVLAGSYTAAPVDPIVPMPPAPPAFNWTGGYVGVFVGALHGNNRWGQNLGASFSTPGDWSRTPAGLMLGYNMQSGGMVYGAELDYTASTLTAVSTGNGGFGCGGPVGCGTDVSRLITLRGRVGFAMDRTLIYGTAGFARANVRGYNPGTATVTGDGSRSGWSAGLGIEHALTDRFTIRAEYLHTDLGRMPLPSACAVNCFTDVSFGQMRLGGAFRF
jgi:outer membrane immunogenic protein